MILQLLIAMLAGWLQRQQQQVITYLQAENRILKGKLRGHRLRLTDTERRRLAALASPLGRKRLQEIAALATPDMLLRWYRCLIAQKFDGSTRPTQHLNAHCERFVRSIKEEALDRVLMHGERSLSYVTEQYLVHYHTERNHQGLGNQLLSPVPDLGSHHGQVKRRERLGGLLSYYYRDAA
jgi:hypothetical protein